VTPKVDPPSIDNPPSFKDVHQYSFKAGGKRKGFSFNALEI